MPLPAGAFFWGKAGSPSLMDLLFSGPDSAGDRRPGFSLEDRLVEAFEREAIMDWQAGGKALELYVNTPELIYASIFAAIAIFGFAWWLRNHISKERIAALQERVSLQEAIINDLRSTGGVPRTQVELLNSANATVVSSLADLEQANTDLGETLSLRV